MKTIPITVIVPVKNESDVLKELVERIDAACRNNGIPYSILFVDDRSTDDSIIQMKQLSAHYPIQIHRKQGKAGKAYSILEGVAFVTTDYVLMIDADLQYPPEAIPAMVAEAARHGVVVANRKVYKSTPMRRFLSRANTFVFGKLLHGLDTDIQSGLKLFHKSIIDHLDQSTIGPWSLDIPLLYTARELGFTIGSVDITFEKRVNGESKIGVLDTAWQIAKGSLALRFKRKKIYHLASATTGSMIGAGIAYQRKRYITHSTLRHQVSALVTFQKWQIMFIGLVLIATGAGLIMYPLATAIAVVGVLSGIYCIDVLFNLYLVLKSLHYPPEISISHEELARLENEHLPVYSILCPLYREAHVVPQFLEAIGKLDWPKSRLDVLLLLEEDDKETIAKVGDMALPDYVRVLVVPHSQPKTKPKACNYGLAHARGEYMVIYDAEDIPDPDQLKKAYLAFGRVPAATACLQAKLNFYNPDHNLLTKLFTAEYSLWFDVVLTGLQSINTSIPLGGTSNHFRTEVLRKLHGWDAFNVTEDCDLGIRLFKEGYQTAVIDSTTLEEATSKAGNWFRQRSRWIKGYLQTYLVHMRNPVEFTADHGLHALIFQLVVGGKIAFMFINPFLWILTISYFTLYAFVGPTIEAVYPTVIFYMAAFSLVFGNFLFLYYYMIGCAKHGHWSVIKYVFIVPFYWLMVSIAAIVALFQLIFKPHYWEKTNHGFHIMRIHSAAARSRRLQRFADFAGSGFVSGGILVAATLGGNVMNFLYNSYLGRTVSIEQFGIISLIGSFIYIVNVPLSALSRTMTHKSAWLLGQYGVPIKAFWVHIRHKSLIYALIASALWLTASPLFQAFFHTDTILPFVLFTPVWFIGTLASIDGGFLGGNLRFGTLAIMTVSEALFKLIFTFAFVQSGQTQYVYAAVPLSMVVSIVIAWRVASRVTSERKSAELDRKSLAFPRKFFMTSILTALTGITFLSFDVIAAKHFLAPVDAGNYGLLSLVGKMVYLLGSLFSGFINPLVSRNLGAGEKSNRLFTKILFMIAGVNLIAFAVFGLFGSITVPILWGAKAAAIIPYLPMYALAMVSFSISTTIISYHQIRGEYLFPVVGFMLGLVEIVGITFFHSSIAVITSVVLASGLFMLGSISLLDRLYGTIMNIYRNGIDFAGLFARPEQLNPSPENKLRILVFNWRDTKHVWAGGAESYLHGLARQWVRMGHEVTCFCGNDSKHPRNQTIDGVHVVRRGGFYTVYLWAAVYYLFRFRGKFDVVIDSENGVPFFTPLYVRVPTFLLIHHVHQEVFRKHLSFPLAQIAVFIESQIMPVVYSNRRIITVSQSSRDEIIRCGLGKADSIDVVHPGVDIVLTGKYKKTTYPSFIYLGRLKPYKHIDVAIRAFAAVRKFHQTARLTIAGEGESIGELRKLAQELGIDSYVSFAGRVNEEEKVQLLSTHWAAIQPSSIEGWGMTVIEANACGTPVIASNVFGLRDSVVNEKTGLLVQSNNVLSFAGAMERMIGNTTERNGWSKSALVWSKSFRWDASAEEFHVIFTKELESAKQPVLNYSLARDN